MDISKLGYTTDVISGTNFSDFTTNVTAPELALTSSQILVRSEMRRYETFRAMSHLVDGDEILRNMLRSKATRDEFEQHISSTRGLDDVLTFLYGQSGQNEVGSLRYNSMRIVEAVDAATDFKEMGTNARLLTAACLGDMLDVFKNRSESTSASWISEHKEGLSPTLDDLINEVLEVTAADKVKHILGKFRKDVKDGLPSKRFNVFAYTTQMHSALRDISLALNDLSYRELYIRDVMQLLARSVLNIDSQMATYGAPRSNTAIQALTSNATLVRLAISNYDKAHVCTIPAHEVRNEAEFIARNLNNLANYDVVSDVASVIQISGYERSQTGSLVSAIISGTRRSVPAVHVYHIIPHTLLGDDFVDVGNRTKEFGNLIPKLPSGFVERFITDTVIVAEEAVMRSFRRKYTSFVLAKADVDENLLHDVVATLCPVSFEKGSSGYHAVYMVVDKEDRLRAISPSNFQHMHLKSAALAYAVVGHLTDSVVTKPLFQTEALLLDGRFSGVWADRNTTPITDAKITIRDMLADDAKDAVTTFELNVFGSPKVLPRYTEVEATAGWANLIDIINNIGEQLNAPGNQKSKIQRTGWGHAVVNLLADWVNQDVAIHSLVNRAITEFSIKAQEANLPEEYYFYNSYYHGMIALQVVLGVMESMAKLSDTSVELNPSVVELLLGHENLMVFSNLVAPSK